MQVARRRHEEGERCRARWHQFRREARARRRRRHCSGGWSEALDPKRPNREVDRTPSNARNSVEAIRHPLQVRYIVVRLKHGASRTPQHYTGQDRRRMRTNVYLTVDTEHSMGGAWANAALHPIPTERRIFCRIAGKDHGIGWLCEELGKRNFRATFFAEMFGSLVFGKDDTRAWCQYLLQRGQDVQLHTHLNFYYYALQQSSPEVTAARTDDIASLPSATRAELLEQACELFYDATGYRPTAFRAGNWRASRALMADWRTREFVWTPVLIPPRARPGPSLAKRWDSIPYKRSMACGSYH